MKNDELAILIEAAIKRVKMENAAGNPILCAWRLDAEKALRDMGAREAAKRRENP